MSPRPFLILGGARTGSNLLRELLDSHPKVVCYGELFNDAERHRILWSSTSRAPRHGDLELRNDEPVRFLAERVFAGHPTRISAVGFKLFYYHARDAVAGAVWPYLRDLEGLAVIHVRRDNLLRKLVSQRLAEATDRWWIAAERDRHAGVSVELSPAECEGYFDRSAAEQRRGAEFFAACPTLDISYEQLAADIGSTGRRMLDFLGVPLAPLITRLVKQTTQPLASVVRNYAELRAHFAGRPEERFFDE